MRTQRRIAQLSVVAGVLAIALVGCSSSLTDLEKEALIQVYADEYIAEVTAATSDAEAEVAAEKYVQRVLDVLGPEWLEEVERLLADQGPPIPSTSLPRRDLDEPTTVATEQGNDVSESVTIEQLCDSLDPAMLATILGSPIAPALQPILTMNSSSDQQECKLSGSDVIIYLPSDIPGERNAGPFLDDATPIDGSTSGLLANGLARTSIGESIVDFDFYFFSGGDPSRSEVVLYVERVLTRLQNS